MEQLEALVAAAQAGDLAAYAGLIRATQTMVYAVTRRILREHADALDATQDAYLRAYRGLGTLHDAAAFPGYLRRTAIRAASDVARLRRATFAPLGEAAEVPALDELESSWTPQQRSALAQALVRLSRDDRRVTDRFYHGRWSVGRLADDAHVSVPTMRKRLQRIRDNLRKEIEIMERQLTTAESLPDSLPERVLELLSRPVLVDLPDSPVGALTDRIKALFPEYTNVETSEIVDLLSARRRLTHDPVYVPSDKLFHVDAARILRYDLSLPLTLGAAGRGAPLRLLTAGKVYRDETESTTHLSAFHQLELLSLDQHERSDAWAFVGRILSVLDALLPGLPQRVERTDYPFCSRAWDIGVEVDGRYVELLGCGVYKPDVVTLLGGDPAQHVALGLGLGLERLASLHYHEPDIRKLGPTA